jgi:LmbE family N-acetylglucosaminyl deacetylase
MERLDKAGRVLIFSPHMDDAVLSCGALMSSLPGVFVATVFGGEPPASAPCTDWDGRCGFGGGAEAMAARRLENARALALLQAHGCLLDFLDAQYADNMAPAGLVQALDGVLRRIAPDTVLAPLGLFHSDHLLVNEAALQVRLAHLELDWLCYEDVLYRCQPGLLQSGLARMLEMGHALTPAALTYPMDAARKAKAVAAYASQLEPLGLTHDSGDAAQPERYWRISERS